jgi:hypothetical protein
MGIEDEQEKSANNQDKRKYHRLRIGEIAAVPLL